MKNLTYKSVSVMKKTRESSNAQITRAEKENLVACAASMGVTHIEITMFADNNSSLISHGFTPSPLTIEAETQEWYDVIHAQSNVYGASVFGGYLKVLDRAIFCGIEAIAGFAADTGTPIGTAAAASTAGLTTWCGRYYNYLNTHVGASHIATGDIHCPIPEITGRAFSGSPFTDQTGMQNTTVQFHAIATAFYAAQGKTCTFLANPNFSEVSSGWWGTYSDSGFNCFDYYGNARGTGSIPADYTYDLGQVYAGVSPTAGYGISSGGYPIFWCEWGDLSGAVMPLGKGAVTSGDNFVSGTTTVELWMEYWINYLKALKVLVDAGKLVGYNYWGGWENQNTSIFYKTGSGASSQYYLNWRGQMLAAFFISNGLTRIPTLTSGSFSEADPSFGGRQMHF